MPYKHVLAAVDLSSESAQVLEKARATADRYGAKLSLITVVKPFTHVYGGLDLVPMPEGSFEEKALKRATRQLEDNGKIYGVDLVDVHVKAGNPAHVIKDSANELEADLIVVGTHGRHGLGLLLGSTANGVLHGVDCDVLAIRVRVRQ